MMNRGIYMFDDFVIRSGWDFAYTSKHARKIRSDLLAELRDVGFFIDEEFINEVTPAYYYDEENNNNDTDTDEYIIANDISILYGK